MDDKYVLLLYYHAYLFCLNTLLSANTRIHVLRAPSDTNNYPLWYIRLTRKSKKAVPPFLDKMSHAWGLVASSIAV